MIRKDTMQWIAIAFWATETFLLAVIAFNTVNLIRGAYDSGEVWFMLALNVFMLATVAGSAFLIYKDRIMKIGVIERVRERRKIAAAVNTAEKYRGINLMDTPEAKNLPTPRYRCSNEGCVVGYPKYTADELYWVDGLPLLPEGWYCVECVGKMPDRSKDDRLNMEVFLILMDSDVSD